MVELLELAIIELKVLQSLLNLRELLCNRRKAKDLGSSPESMDSSQHMIPLACCISGVAQLVQGCLQRLHSPLEACGEVGARPREPAVVTRMQFGPLAHGSTRFFMACVPPLGPHTVEQVFRRTFEAWPERRGWRLRGVHKPDAISSLWY